MSPRRQVRTRALIGSGMALIMMSSGAAFAQCAPDPTVTNGTTVCNGIDANGLRITTPGTRVTVAQGAIVRGAGSDALAVRLAPGGGFGGFGSSVSIGVAGLVDGGANAGVSLIGQPNGGFFQTQSLALTVEAGGAVTGINGVVVGRDDSQGTTSARISIDNSGRIAGTGGIALLSTDLSGASFSSVTNRSGGTIGAILGSVDTLDNAGSIEGGSRSAIDWTGRTGSFGIAGPITNSGTIGSAGPDATLANISGFRTLTNSGTIENRGSGAAITGTDGLALTNAAMGRIASAGTTAISAGATLRLTNAGTIVGDVVVGGGPSFNGSTVDSTAGTILGALRLGGGNDTLTGLFDNGAARYGITGAIDGGDGVDTARVRFAADATIATPIALPAAFEQLEFAPDSGVTTTLANGFTAPGTLYLSGTGTVANRTALTGVGSILATRFESGGAPSFLNAGSITATGAEATAVQLGAFGRFENSGTIGAAGNAVALSGFNGATALNSGTISAAQTALSLSGASLINDAAGLIRSTSGTALRLTGFSAASQRNDGRIEGGDIGVELSGSLANGGVISGGRTGIVFGFSGNGTLDNRVGGSVTGGAVAITTRAAGSGFSSGGNTVVNAGTITGDVLLGDGQSGFTFSANRFFALEGGVLNGNLSLGRGDLLVAELGDGGAGRFAGINGVVSAVDARLVLRARRDTTAAIAPAAGFASIGYDLFDDAALVLTGAAGTPALRFAGRGSVDLTADIALAGGPAIQVGPVTVAPGGTPVDNALTIVSRGALSVTREALGGASATVVALDGNSQFTNAGAIVATDRGQQGFGQFAAITGGFPSVSSGGATVVNSGTITLGGTTGIANVRAVTNSGSIVQAAGGAAAAGIRTTAAYGAGSLVNSGVIDVAGVAVQHDFGQYAILNSGRIASTATVAITSDFGGLEIVNQAGGTIAGGAGQAAIRMGGGTLTNSGTITGSVDLGFGRFGASFVPATYIADGGTIAGGLRFGQAGDTLVSFGALGVSGVIDGGDGLDTLIQARRASETVTLDLPGILNFERFGVRALGADTVLTVRADAPITGGLALSGDGAIVNTASVTGNVFTTNSGRFVDGVFQLDPVLTAFTNQGTITGGVSGEMRRFANSGTITGVMRDDEAVEISGRGTLDFVNSGTIASGGSEGAVGIEAYEANSLTAANTGTITGGLYAYLSDDRGPDATDGTAGPAVLSFINGGTVTADGGDTPAVLLQGRFSTPASGQITLANTGTIEATGQAGIAIALDADRFDIAGEDRLVVTNGGTIRANGGGVRKPAGDFLGGGFLFSPFTAPASALALDAGSGGATVTNDAAGVIEATGDRSVAVFANAGTLDLTNAGTIRGGAGTTLTADDALGTVLGQSYLAGAVQSLDGNDRIVNTGTILGSVDLGGGNDRIDNLGRIEGNVFLGAGDDTFLQRASATMLGTVDAGAGDDLVTVDATGGGAVNGDRFVNFERFSQIGEGTVAYSGTFRFSTIGIAGGTVTVANGQTLTSDGSVTITGTDAAETVLNDGTITGDVALAGGDDRVVNNGAIGGSVLLGDGNDSFVEGAGSRVGGRIDGGAGTDTYGVRLSGDRTGLNARTGFERLAVEGGGTLGLTLDQGFEATSLAGAGLTVALNGFTLGPVTGSAAAERLAVDGDVASVALGGGDDMLALGTARAGGRYDGGAGSDMLRFTATGPVTLSGVATGFEQIVLPGNALTVTGTLGAAGDTLAFGDGVQTLVIAAGGTLAGRADLGGGDDSLRLAAGAAITGSVAGGAGTDTATVETAGGRTLNGGALSGFEVLASEGSGTLTLTGAHAYDQLLGSTDVAIAADGSLAARQVRLSGGARRFTIAGGFAGGVEGSVAADAIAVSGGSAATPVAFTSVTGVDAFAMTGGYATVSGSAALGAVDLSGGRLVGLTGSTIAAARIAVGRGATFGSAGTVNGDIAVSGTLSPGASPGTMTVNGNVALASGSTSVFELASAVQDKLVVNGAVTIAQGAALQLVPIDAVRPGVSYDLITASAGITGSFSTVTKPDGLFGFIVQSSNRIQLLGQFLDDAGFSPQVSRSIAYANQVLAAQPANNTLFAALPALTSGGGASNPRAFAQITPEAYATATQIGVENALALRDAARGPAFAPIGAEPGAFTFGQAIGSWYRLADDGAEGTSAARTSSYGFLGGIGYGGEGWMAGAFGGYLDSRQRIDTLGTRTDADGWVAGVHGRYEANGIGIGASIAYNDADADTRRALPGGAGAVGRYDLKSWVADLSVGRAFAIGDWALRPQAGLTYLRTTRGRLTESGGPFALAVARDRQVAGFADAGVRLDRGADAAFRPFVALGLRYQIEGRRADALAGYAGGPTGLLARGASRDRAVGTVDAGLAYRLTTGLELYSTASAQTGRDDHRETVSVGARFRF